MLKMEITVNRTITEKAIDFSQVMEILQERVSKASQIKTVFNIPSYKGVALSQVSYWDKPKDEDTYIFSTFNGNIIIDGNNNAIAINENANVVLRDRNTYFEVYFKDYNFGLIIQ